MGYYNGPLRLDQAKELARNTANQHAARAAIPRGWCEQCRRQVRLLPGTATSTARFVHAEDFSPLCKAPADNGIEDPVGTMTLCRDCDRAVVVWVDTWVNDDGQANQIKVWRHMVKPGCYHDPQPCRSLWERGGTLYVWASQHGMLDGEYADD